ncbi:MAG: MFS transporter [Dysgonomonas sp.]
MKSKKVFFKLCIMMFMQYFIFAVWWVPFAAYLEKSLNLDMSEVSLILCAMAIGSMASSVIGVIADRRFSAEKVLAALNLLTAVFLFIAIQQTTFVGLMITVTLVMLCYMPTWSLTSSIAMTHVPAEQFPRMRLIGSIGWFASGVFSLVAVYVFKVDIFDGAVYPMYCGVAAGVVAAVLNLTLPKTPPSGKNNTKFSLKDIFGLRTLSILKNKNYNIFIFLTFLAIIPFTLYHVYGSTFFSDVEVKNITVTMNWGIVVEMIFLFVTTTILIKCGFKKTLLFGLIAMLLRYLSFYLGVEMGQPWLYSIGILTHGIIFGLFFVVGQVYTDKVAPVEIRAQAQGFLSFLVWGVGYLIGTLLNGYLIGNYRLEETANWGIVFGISTVFTLILIVLFIILFKQTDKSIEENTK